MKLNLDFYKEKQEELLPIDEEITQIIKEKKQQEYQKIDIILATSKIRKNILNWYPFKENATILEIEPNFGEITGLLCEKAQKVVSIESSKKKAEAIQIRHNEKNNLEIIVGKLEDIELQEKFDYITLIGTLEKIDNLYTGKIENYIQLLTKFLKEDGKILLAVDNQLGMKYFSKTDETGINITNIVGKKAYTLDELGQIIEHTGLVKNKVYYPMPDYKLPNVIYTDEKTLSKNNLSRNIVYNSENTIKFYSENQVYRELLEKNNFTFSLFANSYLLEITKTKQKPEDIYFVSFSNMRKPEYQIKTIIKKENVYKYALNDKSKKHIEQIKNNIDIMKKSGLNTVDSYEQDKIISKYTESPTLDKVIINLIKENETEKAINLIKKFKNELESKLEKAESKNNVFDKYNIKYEEKEIEKMNFIKHGLWDLTFDNCFYIDNEMYFYDQEWKEENVPIDFILYRAIKYFTRIKKYISEQKLYEIMDINQKAVELFDQLDERLQLTIRDETMWNLNTQGTNVIELKRKELTANHQVNLLMAEKEVYETNKKIIEQQKKELEIEVEKLKETLNYIYNSKSWKITKPFRNLLKHGKKQKGINK